MATPQDKSAPKRGISATLKTGAVKSYGCATGACAGFRDFILRGSVVDLAVAVVVGTSFTALINAIVSDWLNPLIGTIFSANGFFGDLSFTVRGSVFAYGHFLNVLFTFLAICIILYFLVVLPINTLIKMTSKPAKKTRECPECLSDIPLKASRCKFCCSAVAPLATALTATATGMAAASVGPAPAGKGAAAEQDPEKGLPAAQSDDEDDDGEVVRKAPAPAAAK